MADLVRLSFSLEEPLAQRLERLVRQGGYENRSEYIRDMIRDRLVAEEWEKNAEAVGTVTLVYDHHTRNLNGKLTAIQHGHCHEVLASTHVHLTHELCVEMILIRGKAGRIRELADRLRRLKGVLHATLSLGSTGKKLA